MQEDKSQLINCAMLYGLYLGTFWVIKYFVFIASLQFPIFSMLEVFLRLGTPILLFYFLIKYRVNILEGQMGYWHGVQFSILLFFFAALLEAIIIFVHTTWLAPTYISDMFDTYVTMVESLNLDPRLAQAFEEQPTPSPINYTFSNMMANVFVGMLLSLIIVPLANQFNPRQKSDF